MELNTTELNGAQIARVTGRFDAHEVPQARAWFDARKPARAIVNLAGATFLDSAALSLLVQQMKHCRERGGDLVLCGLAQPVRVIFELTRLDRAFRIAADEAGAVAALTPD